MANVDRVCEAELCGGFEENVSDALHNWGLLPLPNVDHLQKAAVAFAQVQDVAEDFIDELVNFAQAYYGRVCGAERTDEQRLDSVQVTEVLLLLVDELVDDTIGPRARLAKMGHRAIIPHALLTVDFGFRQCHQKFPWYSPCPLILYTYSERNV